MGKYPLKREMLDTKVGVAITTVGGVAITTVGGVAITTVGGVALVIYDLVMTTSFFFRMRSSWTRVQEGSLHGWARGPPTRRRRLLSKMLW